MHELAEKEALHLLPNHIFQFDFLNDELFDTPCARHKDSLDSKCKDCKESKLPKSLQHILKDPKKREKLIIYINPPYAEAGTTAQTAGTGSNKAKVATDNAAYLRYKDSMGKASNELFAQFFFRIYNEIPHCTLASFSTLKYINSSNFIKFRETFKARFLGGFVCPAYTFDNVKGQFPIGFLVWNLNKNDKAIQKIITLDVYNEKNEYMGEKRFYLLKNTKTKRFNEYLQKFDDKQCQKLAILMADAPDFQNNNHVAIMTSKTKGHWIFKNITPNNLIPFSVYFSVRHAIKATWLNDRDQFLYPNNKWEKDSEFQNDCLAFTLFHGQNRITSRVDSTNGGGGKNKQLYSFYCKRRRGKGGFCFSLYWRFS